MDYIKVLFKSKSVQIRTRKNVKTACCWFFCKWIL